MKKFLKLTSIILVCLFVSGWMIIFFLPRPPLLQAIDFSKVIYDRNLQPLRLTLSRDQQYRLYTPLSKIAPQLIQATLLQEDQYFRHHYGINPLSIIKAGWQTYVLKSRRLGASTITMQVARLRQNIPSSKFFGKLQQIILALQFEMHYSKDAILEAYFNLAPYGGNIQGAGAASLIYFNNTADKLSLSQALILSVIPQNPTKRRPDNDNLKQIRNRLFNRWLIKHPQDKNLLSIMNLPLQMRRLQAMPFRAPHFVTQILQQNPEAEGAVITSLDLKMQNLVERITRQYLQRKSNLGVNNAAVLLIDTRDMSVKSSLGSAGFFDKEISGQINGTDIKRSPGSTLKPFVYALALDQGLIHPNTVLKDVPHRFENYNPENFDYDFMGPIRAREALTLSRNIPAVYLASQLMHPSLFGLLEQAKISQLKPESWYGLALSLGSVELNMKELSLLYAMLANDGLWYPLRTLEQEARQPGKRLISAEAAFLTLDMLSNTPRPESMFHNNRYDFPVSWKTGTSSGYRDAWSAGIFGPYVLTVWIGNFDNTGNAAFVGKNIAAPLFFELITAIRNASQPFPTLHKNPQLMNLQQVEVCKASGMLPTRYCTDTEMTWFIPGKSPIKTDTVYREVAVNKKTGLRSCHIDENTRFEIFEFWPSDLLKIFKQAGIQRRTPPMYEENCSLLSNIALSPQITSPQSRVQYIVRTDSTQKTQIPFIAVTDGEVKTLYWFINETFLAATRADKPFLWSAKAGKFVVRVVDDHGLSDARDIKVQVDG